MKATSSTKAKTSASSSSSSQLQFHAIRKCDSLTGPAVFLAWEDCSFYLDEDENDGKVDYKSFDDMVDAMTYISELVSPTITTTTTTTTKPMNNTKSVAGRGTAAVVGDSSSSRKRSLAAETLPSKKVGQKKKNSSSSPTPVAFISKEDGNMIPLYAQPTIIDSNIEKGSSSTSTRKKLSKKATQDGGGGCGEHDMTFDLIDETMPPSTKKGRAPRRISKAKKDDFDLKFETNFKLLQEYKEQYNTCDVPVSTNKHTTVGKFEGLGKWVFQIRRDIRSNEQNEKGEEYRYLDNSQIDRLMSIGFVMNPIRGTKVQTKKILSESSEREWDDMFHELQTFKEKNGHTNVPHIPKSSLRNWIVRQRAAYVKLKEGKPTTLTATKITKLTDLGFSFSTYSRTSFDERALQWLEFKNKHGRDPKTESEGGLCALGKWVGKQRTKYALLKQGKPTNLTQEQADKLTEWGFNWTSRMKKPERRPGPNKSWETRLAELVAYKEQHGDTLVPQMYPELGYWVHKQRTEYKKFIEGKQSHMTAEKVAKLNGVGFAFQARRRRRVGGRLGGGSDNNNTQQEKETTTTATAAATFAESDCASAGEENVQDFNGHHHHHQSYLRDANAAFPTWGHPYGTPALR